MTDVVEMRRELARRIDARTPLLGENTTPVAGLALYRRAEPTACLLARYEPSFTVFVQGRKRIDLRGTVYHCDERTFLVSSIDVPAESQIVEASVERPMLSMFMKLDMPTVREVVSREELPEAVLGAPVKGLAVGETTVGMLDACMRLMGLLETPEDVPFLGPMLHRELIYRILRTPQGQRLRTIATAGDLSNRTAKAIAWLKENYAKPLRIEELAEVARMGVSTLHHQFRALTAMSPLQYQKQIRLHTARQRMLVDRVDATSAAFEVGYESVSQFNREYSRLFGQPPMRDVKALRAGDGAMLDVA